MFGGLFSSRGEQAPPVPMSIQALAQPASETQVDRSFEYALDALPCNAMFCDRELILRYLNRASLKTLHTLQQYLPVPVDQIVGKSIHVFHKSQQNIDKLLVVWGVSTQQAIDALKKAQESQRDDIEHLNGNLQMVATATHEIESSIAEIAKNAMEVAQATEKSRAASTESKTAIESLRASSSGVAKVAELIASIATQTSVLALNANIEAARAGAHGKGFAVVASEVRKLAEQTAAATAEIQAKVAAIGVDITTGMAAIDRISSQTEELSLLSHQMAAAAEEQHLATQEMAQNLERAAHRTSEIADMRIEERILGQK
jgi:methyl-accepting chemotaxis protein